MKKTLLTIALAACTVASFAQGRISIANDAGRLFEIGAPAGTDAAGPILNQTYSGGVSIVLALYAGMTSDSMTLQTSYALTGANFLSAGRGATKPLTLNGVTGGAPRFFNIVLTDTGAVLPANINGANYSRNATTGVDADAYASLGPNAVYYGSSGLFQFTPSTSAISAPALNGTGTTWQTGSMYINAVPEPSSIALAGLGAASLLIFRRRK